MDKMEKTTEKKKGFVREFTDFLQTFGVIGLAIGFVIGVASSAVVNSLVKDLINPIVGLVLPTGNLASLNDPAHTHDDDDGTVGNHDSGRLNRDQGQGYRSRTNKQRERYGEHCCLLSGNQS